VNRAAWFVATLALCALTSPPPAPAASEWTEGPADVRPFSTETVTDAYVGDVRKAPGIALERKLLWEYLGPDDLFDPFSVTVLPNGNVLTASRNSNSVLEVSRAKRVVWSYTRANDYPSFINVYSAQRLANGNTLITDRRLDRVLEVTSAKQIVWQYGHTMVDSSDASLSVTPGALIDPFSATRLANGNTLIVDNRGGRRVIEVRTSDYDPSAPNWGYAEASIVWRYGTDGIFGTGPNELASPRSASRLANGNTLISDAGDKDMESNQVLEITPSGAIAWSFGVAGSGAVDETHVYGPSTAERLSNGNTLISEEDGRRILEVNAAGGVVDWYGAGEPIAAGGAVGKMRGATRTVTGSTMIADQEHSRLIEIGYPPSGTFESSKLGLGAAGYSAILKEIHGIEALGSFPAGTSVTLAYKLDEGPWVETGETSVTLPPRSEAYHVAYRLTLKTQTAAYTPIVRAVKFSFDLATDDSDDDTDTPPPDDTDDDTDTPPEPDDSDDDTDTPPPGDADDTEAPGDGNGNGSSGNGSGSGGSRSTRVNGSATKALAKSAGTVTFGPASDGDAIPVGADARQLLRGTLLQAIAGRTGGDSGKTSGFAASHREGTTLARSAVGSAALVLVGSFGFGMGGDSLLRLAQALARRSQSMAPSD